MTASVALVAVWLFLFSGPGLVNQILGPLAPDPSWLINPYLAMPTIALFVTWKGMGFYILLYLAALQNVPEELYESAATDGAGAVRTFFSVTVPGVRPATLLVSCSRRSPVRTSSPSRTCSPTAAARTGRPRRPCC